jgi:hypothetical protein
MGFKGILKFITSIRGGQGDNFFKLHFWGKEDFPASRSVPTLNDGIE